MSARKLKLKASPRLYVSEDIADHLKDRLHGPYLQAEAKRVLRDADRLVREQALKEGSGPSYLGTTRTIDSHLRCLTCAWVLTHDERYREAAVRHLGTFLTFNHISCEANTATPANVKLPFCLSYGELSATVGLMYDLFRRDLTDDERQVFFDVLNRFLLRQALSALDDPPWWAFQDWSNWNGVCSGGMGIMALAFYDDIPEARRIIPFVEKSLGEYFSSYIEDGGGCHEGTGYWNYGMSYAVRYLLSWEHATGRQHPAMKIKELAQSLWFPLDFNGISFGDNDHWGPAGFYFMFAKRTNQPDTALIAAARLLAAAPTSPNAATAGPPPATCCTRPTVSPPRRRSRSSASRTGTSPCRRPASTRGSAGACWPTTRPFRACAWPFAADRARSGATACSTC